jgi:hypothetical protein
MICAISTTDNPFNPLTQYENWNAYDTLKGYNLGSLLARLVRDGPDMSPDDEEDAIEEAVDKIVAMNPTGNCKKVVLE